MYRGNRHTAVWKPASYLFSVRRVVRRARYKRTISETTCNSLEQTSHDKDQNSHCMRFQRHAIWLNKAYEVAAEAVFAIHEQHDSAAAECRSASCPAPRPRYCKRPSHTVIDTVDAMGKLCLGGFKRHDCLKFPAQTWANNLQNNQSSDLWSTFIALDAMATRLLAPVESISNEWDTPGVNQKTLKLPGHHQN